MTRLSIDWIGQGPFLKKAVEEPFEYFVGEYIEGLRFGSDFTIYDTPVKILHWFCHNLDLLISVSQKLSSTSPHGSWSSPFLTPTIGRNTFLTLSRFKSLLKVAVGDVTGINLSAPGK